MTENPQMVGKVFAEIKVVYVERLPIIVPNNTDQIQLCLLVKKMLEDPNDNDTDSEIDEIVYRLYGVTDEERKVVEHT